MTTKIERRIFGIPAGKRTITSEEAVFQINPIIDRSITVHDRPYGSTDITDAQATLKELVDRALIFVEHRSWEITDQQVLQPGESVTVGPLWNRLRVTRE